MGSYGTKTLKISWVYENIFESTTPRKIQLYPPFLGFLFAKKPFRRRTCFQKSTCSKNGDAMKQEHFLIKVFGDRGDEQDMKHWSSYVRKKTVRRQI